MSYTVTKIKSMRGREGYGFNATLVRDGKAVCLVMNDASGGPTDYEWADHKLPRVDGERRNYDGKLLPVKMSPEEKKWNDFVNNYGSYQYYGENVLYTEDVLIEHLMNEVKLDQRVKKMLKDKVCLVEKGRVATIKLRAGYSITPEVLGKVAEKYPQAQVLNSLPEAEAVTIIKNLLRDNLDE